MNLYVQCIRIEIIYWFGNGSWRISDLSLTNSLATSSLLRCDKIRNIVHPVSSICIRLPSASHRAQDPYKNIYIKHT